MRAEDSYGRWYKHSRLVNLQTREGSVSHFSQSLSWSLPNWLTYWFGSLLAFWRSSATRISYTIRCMPGTLWTSAIRPNVTMHVAMKVMGI